jgi:hypothetical protein
MKPLFKGHRLKPWEKPPLKKNPGILGTLPDGTRCILRNTEKAKIKDGKVMVEIIDLAYRRVMIKGMPAVRFVLFTDIKINGYVD